MTAPNNVDRYAMPKSTQLCDFLLVEDDLFDIKFVERLTARMEPCPTFKSFQCGQAALSWLANQADDALPKFMLVDINMPKLDGFDFVRRLQADPRLATIAVALVTSSDSPHDQAAAKELGVYDYVVKSANPDRLNQVIASLLRADQINTGRSNSTVLTQ